MDKATIITWLEFLVLLALFGYATIHVVRKTKRHKLSPLGLPEGKGQRLRFIVCGVLVLGAFCLLYFIVNGVREGKIFVDVMKHVSNHGFTLYRSEYPSGFWMAICAYSFLGLLFLYLAIVEIIYAIKQGKNVRHNRAA